MRIVTALLLLPLVLYGCSGTGSSGGGTSASFISVTPDVIRKLEEDRQPPAEALMDQFLPLTESKTSTYRTGAGDRLYIAISTTDETGALKRIYPPTVTNMRAFLKTVPEHGGISLPYLDRVDVLNKTATEIESDLKQAYADARIYTELLVEVEIAEFRSQAVNITGGVKEPGTYYLDDKGSQTLVSAIMMAGGFKPNADASQVAVHHADGSRDFVNLNTVIREGNVAHNIPLAGGDIIYVPDNSREYVYVLGEVRYPRIERLDNGDVTALKAIAQASGVNHGFASMSNIYVVRGYPTRKAIAHLRKSNTGSYPVTEAQERNIRVYSLDMSQPEMLAMAEQFPLQSRDIIYVATSPLGEWSRFISMLLPSSLNNIIVSGVSVDDELDQ